MSVKWADYDDEEVGVPEDSSSFDKASGIKTYYTYRTHKGKKYKKVTKVRVVTMTTRVPKHVADRRKTWKKFGLAEGKAPGPEKGITYKSLEDVFMTRPGQEKKDDQADLLSKLTMWASSGGNKKRGEAGDTGGDGIGPSASTGKEGVYVPPNRTKGASGGMMTSDSRFNKYDDGHTLRVTNISEEATEADLQELFRAIGRTTRIYLAKDKLTNLSRGFAFVTYMYKEDAEKAMEKLNGYGYDHLILKLEWAKPSTKPAGDGAGGLSGGFRSGYGKALPQGKGK